MNTYLSIDLDFWCDESSPKAATRFFRRLFRLWPGQIMVALHHHHLVRHINRIKGLDAITTIDYHSDLMDELGDSLTLEEGNWANFVNFQDRGTFIWRYPGENCLDQNTGYCHRHDNPFEVNCTSWAHTKKKEGLAGIPWKSVRAVGVCLSPTWLLENSKAVSYPIEALDFYEWAGRWWTCSNLPDSVTTDMQDGTGIFKPRLTHPKRVV